MPHPRARGREAWALDPLHSVDAPPTPFALPEYHPFAYPAAARPPVRAFAQRRSARSRMPRSIFWVITKLASCTGSTKSGAQRVRYP